MERMVQWLINFLLRLLCPLWYAELLVHLEHVTTLASVEASNMRKQLSVKYYKGHLVAHNSV